jgi:hypothetical protein
MRSLLESMTLDLVVPVSLRRLRAGMQHPILRALQPELSLTCTAPLFLLVLNSNAAWV